MKRKCLLLCLILFLTSCAARVKDQVIRDAGAGRCEEAIAVFEKNAVPEKVWQKTKQIGGATASGIATGALAVTETTIYILPGIAVGVVVCSPLIALEVATRSSGDASVRCVTLFGAFSLAAATQEPEKWLTSRVWKGTETWRLESYDDLSRMLRGTSACYADRNTRDALLTAEKQLMSIRESLWHNISEEEKRQVDMLLNHIRTRMNPVGAE